MIERTANHLTDLPALYWNDMDPVEQQGVLTDARVEFGIDPLHTKVWDLVTQGGPRALREFSYNGSSLTEHQVLTPAGIWFSEITDLVEPTQSRIPRVYYEPQPGSKRYCISKKIEQLRTGIDDLSYHERQELAVEIAMFGIKLAESSPGTQIITPVDIQIYPVSDQLTRKSHDTGLVLAANVWTPVPLDILLHNGIENRSGVTVITEREDIVITHIGHLLKKELGKFTSEEVK